MANYANRSQKRDAKGKGKVGSSGPPLALKSVMVVSAAAPVGVAASSGGVPPNGKSVPPYSGTEVAAVPPKRRRITKLGIFHCCFLIKLRSVGSIVISLILVT
jgi:hypothetical protein